MPKRLVFFGTPSFAIPCLKALENSRHDLVAVISQPDKKRGRRQRLESPPLAQYAKNQGLRLYQYADVAANLAELQALNADIFITAAFGQIFPQELLDLCPYPALNVHASLLPKYRGAAPVQAAIMAGDQRTGISIMKMEKSLDTGPVYLQKEIEILDSDTATSLEQRLADLASSMLTSALDLVFAGTRPKEQDHQGASYTSKITRATARLDFNRPVLEVFNLIRAMQAEPGAWCLYKSKPFKIIRASLSTEPVDLPPASIKASKKSLDLACQDFFLHLEEVQNSSGKILAASDIAHNFRTGEIFQ